MSAQQPVFSRVVYIDLLRFAFLALGIGAAFSLGASLLILLTLAGGDTPQEAIAPGDIALPVYSPPKPVQASSYRARLVAAYVAADTERARQPQPGATLQTALDTAQHTVMSAALLRVSPPLPAELGHFNADRAPGREGAGALPADARSAG